MIGVNVVAHEPKDLKEVMDKEELPWRSFADPGAIVSKWNLSGTPTFYVLDSHGVIRYKWVGAPGENAMDAALEKMILEAEKDER